MKNKPHRYEIIYLGLDMDTNSKFSKCIRIWSLIYAKVKQH